MKVLHVSSLLWSERIGGAEAFVYGLADAQASAGHEVAVAAVTREFRESYIQGGIRVFPMGHTTPFFIGDWSLKSKVEKQYYKIALQVDWGIVNRLKEVVSTFKPDIVNTHSLSELTPLIWPMIAKSGVPIVHTLHDFTSMCTNGSLFHGGRVCEGDSCKCRLVRMFHRRQSVAVNAVVGVGKDVLHRHLDAGFFTGIPPSKRKVVWNAIADPRPSTGRSKASSDTDVVFGYLGRIEPPKGVDVLINALRHLPNTGWRLVIAGQAPEGIERYRAEVNGFPVTFPGQVDADSFYEDIDCLIVPPVWPEAFGRTVAEACLREVPVIGSNIAGVAEQIELSNAGLLFPPGNSLELSKVMKKVIESHAFLDIAKGKSENFRPRVDISNVLQEYNQLYMSTIRI